MKSRSPQELLAENQLLKKIGTRTGFIQYYFSQLPKFNTQKETFESINEKYFELYGENRYESYESFRKQLSREISKK